MVTSKFDPIICALCGATCTERKDLNRFNRRHPAKCRERMAFTKSVAEGVRSVEFIDPAKDKLAHEIEVKSGFRDDPRQTSRATFRSVQEDL